MTHHGHRARLRAALALFLALWGWWHGASAGSIVVVRVTADGLNIRAAPSGDSAVIGYLGRGDTVVATLGSFDRWLLVMNKQQQPGYVSAAHVELVRVLAVDGEATPRPPSATAPCAPSGPVASLEIESVDVQCRDGPPDTGIASCTAWFSVSAATGCGVTVYRAVDCQGRFFYRLDGDDDERLERVGGAGVMELAHGYGSAAIEVEWRAPPDAPPVVHARLEDGTCEIR